MDARGLTPASFLSDAFIDGCAQAVDMRRALPWPEPTIHGDTVWMGAADAQGRMSATSKACTGNSARAR